MVIYVRTQKNILNLKRNKKNSQNGYHSQVEDYRDINVDEKSKYITDKLSKLTIHEKLQKLNPNNVKMDFDATSI